MHKAPKQKMLGSFFIEKTAEKHLLLQAEAKGAFLKLSFIQINRISKLFIAERNKLADFKFYLR